MILHIRDDAEKVDLLESFLSHGDGVLTRLNAREHVYSGVIALGNNVRSAIDAVKSDFAVWYSVTALVGYEPGDCGCFSLCER